MWQFWLPAAESVEEAFPSQKNVQTQQHVNRNVPINNNPCPLGRSCMESASSSCDLKRTQNRSGLILRVSRKNSNPLSEDKPPSEVPFEDSLLSITTAGAYTLWELCPNACLQVQVRQCPGSDLASVCASVGVG